MDIEFSISASPTEPQRNTCEVEVVESSRLTTYEQPEKRHCAFRLPERLSYTAGDYLAVSPRNPSGLVDQIMQHFALQKHTVMKVNNKVSSVPTGQWLLVKDVLTELVELQQPIALKVCNWQSSSHCDKSLTPFARKCDIFVIWQGVLGSKLRLTI